MAVRIGARIGAMAGPDEVLTSRTVRDLSAGSALRFEASVSGTSRVLPRKRNFSASLHEQAFRSNPAPE
jgi:class 3 adenylate cyclase